MSDLEVKLRAECGEGRDFEVWLHYAAEDVGHAEHERAKELIELRADRIAIDAEDFLNFLSGGGCAWGGNSGQEG